MPAYVVGWARRFWQGSTDHRGVPKAPGRVATLVEDAGSVCWGVAYRVESAHRSSVLRELDHRERGGFARRTVPVRRAGEGDAALAALTYVADAANPNYLGPAPLEEIAAQIGSAQGPSGSNREYLLRLEASLREIGACDDHVSGLAELLRLRG